MTTTRCTAAERAKLRIDGEFPAAPWNTRNAYKPGEHVRPIAEPALGTLDQRLDIIRRRLGPTRIVLTREERAQRELADCSWAAEEVCS